MVIVNMHKAKTELSRLVARAEAGEEVLIARRDMPVVRLVPMSPKRVAPRQLAPMQESGKDIDWFTHSPEDYVSQEDLDRYYMTNPRYGFGAPRATGFAEDGQPDLGGVADAIRANREFVIMQDGKPVARVVPMAENKKARGFGALAHLRPVPDAFFFDPLPEEELRAWEGEHSFDPDRREP